MFSAPIDAQISTSPSRRARPVRVGANSQPGAGNTAPQAGNSRLITASGSKNEVTAW